MKPRCHFDPARGWLMPEHVRDCTDHDCRGCKPCPESHCEHLDRCANHVKRGAGIYTCPACIGRVRTDLAEIVDLYALVPFKVETRSNDSGQLLDEASDAGIDSEAFNLIGPAATTEQYTEKRTRLRALYERRGWCDWPRHEGFRDDDPHHPYAVLGRWDMAMRESYGPQTDLFVTVTTAADYLRGLLNGEFPHTQEFQDFAREIATCRAHLEDVTHNSRTPEEGRHCPKCTDERGKGPRLRKRYAAHPGLNPGEQCQVEKCRTCDGDDDTWHCPENPEHWWSERDYRRHVAIDYVKNAELLTMADLPERTGVTASTLRRWAGRKFLRLDENLDPVYQEPKLKARGRSAEGRKLYRVSDVDELSGVSLDIETLDVSKSG